MEHKSKKVAQTREIEQSSYQNHSPHPSSASKLELVAGHQKWSDREIGLEHGVDPGSPALDTGLNCHRIGTESAPRNFRIGFEIGL